MALIELSQDHPGDMQAELRKVLEAAGVPLAPDGQNPIQAYIIEHPGAPWCFGEGLAQAAIDHRRSYIEQNIIPEDTLDFLDELVRQLWDDPRCQELREKSDYWKIYGGDPAKPLW